MGNAWRGGLERRTEPLLRALARQPRWVPAAVAGGLLLGGLFAPGAAGAVLLLLLVTVLAWFSALSWPSVHGAPRAIRVATIAMLLVVAILKLK